ELPEITAKEVFDLAKAGDEAALACAKKSMDYLGRGLAGVCYVTDPEIVIIGGGVSMAGEFLLELLVPSFNKYAKLSDKHPRFVLAGLGGSAGMYGSAKAALDLL
ncbi:MAG: ROK family protein, partial [Firmicutes bacterium]|nr:ROK family protein [Bacillota bacterium]